MDTIPQVSYKRDSSFNIIANVIYRRHADRIASYWLTRLRDSPPPKRLNYLYLVNDIVQNSKARKREEFPNAFAPLMAEATQTAYRSSTQDIQLKLRRLVEVWKQRNVFEAPIVAAIETRLEEVDKTRGTKKTLMGSSLFTGSSSSGGVPKELETLVPLQTAVSKANFKARPALETANNEYEKLNDPDAKMPSPPVHAARLSALMKSLATADSSVAESIKTRKALIEDLEKLLGVNKDALSKDEATYLDLSSRRISTEAKKREVEDNIMRGLSAEPSNGSPDELGRRSESVMEPERPDFEAFTPPEATTPIGSPSLNPQPDNPPDNPELQSIIANMSAAPVRTRPGSSSGPNGMSAKRRKMSHEDYVPDLGGMGMDMGSELGNLDDDVDELLRKESARV
jgi:regulator of Ty1 transposition protein 103